MNINDSAKAILGYPGRLISASKGQYHYDNPDNIAVFNGNVVTSAGEKIWYGDIDLTLEESKLIQLAREVNQKIYLLREMDARFENEESPKLEKAVYSTDGEVSSFDEERFARIDGKLVYKPKEAPSEEEVKALAEKARNSYRQNDFEVVRLKLDDISESDEDYNDYNFFSITRCFEGLSEDISPLHQFQKHFIEKEGFEPEAVLKVYLTKEDAERLKKQNEYWYRVFHGEWQTEYRISSDLSMLWFNYGPNNFAETPAWADEGRIYVKKP